MSTERNNAVASPFAIDLRALAALRIVLAAVLFVDLGLRLGHLGFHYTDAAPYSLERARALMALPVFPHLASGAAWFQAGLLVLALGCAALLALGWRTRWMTLVSWYLLVSLHHRSYHIQDVGDQFLRLLLLWGVFLPLGARYALDARAGRDATGGRGNPAGPGEVQSIASAGLVLQTVLIYFLGAFHKLQGDLWRSGEALAVVLRDDVWVRPLGAALLEVPGLPRALTWFTLAVETLAPLLLLSPFHRRACRTVAVALLGCFTLGIGLSLELGVIPWVIGAALIPFLPGRVFDLLDRALARSPRIHAGDPALAPSATRGRARRALARLIPGLLLVQMVASSVDSLHYPGRIPAAFKRAEFALGLDQAWAMYAPNPVVISFRMHLRLDLEDGSEVRLVLGSPREGWPDGETLPSLEAFWNGYRGRMLLDNITYPEFAPDLRPFLVWACRQWSAAHPERPVRSAGLSKEVRAVRPAELAPGALYPEPRTDPLVGHLCADHD